MRHHQIDKRAKRTVPRQVVSDYGMHKDAEPQEQKKRVFRFRPVTGRRLCPIPPVWEA
jgi:hypothetical protein